MAELVLGLATSHSPLLSTPPERWNLRAKPDRANRQHYFRGHVYDFETLVWERAVLATGREAPSTSLHSLAYSRRLARRIVSNRYNVTVKGKVMSVLHIPDDVLRRLGPSDHDALMEISCRLYETNRLTFDEGARMAGIDLETFAAACASRKIPVYWYESEDLESDLGNLNKMRL